MVDTGKLLSLEGDHWQSRVCNHKLSHLRIKSRNIPKHIKYLCHKHCSLEIYLYISHYRGMTALYTLCHKFSFAEGEMGKIANKIYC